MNDIFTSNPNKTRIAAILNPKAGGDKSRWKKDLSSIRDSGFSVSEIITSYRREATQIVKNLDCDVVIAVGGDGTISEIIEGISTLPMSERPVLAICPCGTGNDFYGALCSNRSMGEKMRLNDILSVDVGYATLPKSSFYFANISGVGFSAEATSRYTHTFSSWPAMLGYAASTITTLFEYHNRTFDMVCDGIPRTLKANSLIVANGSRFGQGMKIAPNADPTDNLFDVVIVGNVSKPDLLWNYPRMYTGAHVHHPKVEVLKARHVKISCRDLFSVEADGDLRGLGPVEYKIIPNSIRLLL